MERPRTPSPARVPKEPHRKPRSTGYDQLLKSGAFSDFIIKGNGRADHIHEANSGIIDLSAYEADALGAVIKYFYTGQLALAKSFKDVDTQFRPAAPELCEDPMRVLNVHILADKYDVEDLTKLTAELFTRLAEKFKYSVPFSTWLVAVLEDTSPQSILRKEMFQLVLSSRAWLFEEGFEDSEQNIAALKAALIRCPEFAVDLLAASAQEGKAELRLSTDTIMWEFFASPGWSRRF
ncbi:hypothetical protein LTR95_016235 [Oleoguttula sp. CCFEE 5521]